MKISDNVIQTIVNNIKQRLIIADNVKLRMQITKVEFKWLCFSWKKSQWNILLDKFTPYNLTCEKFWDMAYILGFIDEYEQTVLRHSTLREDELLSLNTGVVCALSLQDSQRLFNSLKLGERL